VADVAYDVAIIGSGPGGYPAAFRAAKYGLKTVMIEKDPYFGGTCLHVGCIPTKALLFQAEVYDHIQRAEEFGIKVSGAKLDWAKMLARKRDVVQTHAKGLAMLAKKNKVDTLEGFGRVRAKGPSRSRTRARRRPSRQRTSSWPPVPWPACSPAWKKTANRY
jgi:dihydrolipoamide dehydrogenase